MFCGACGAEMEGNAKVCNKCGSAVNSAYFCPKCGEEISLDDVFCPFCRFKIIKSEEEVMMEKTKAFEKILRFISDNFHVIKFFYSDRKEKSALLEKTDAFCNNKKALLFISDISKITIHDDSHELLDWCGFSEVNCIEKNSVTILQKEADMIGNYASKNYILCCVEDKMVCYRFAQSKDGSVTCSKSKDKNVEIYDLPEGTRYIVENCAIVDDKGKILWTRKKEIEETSNPVSLNSDLFPAPFWKFENNIINIITGKVALEDFDYNGFEIKTYKDNQTYKKIMEISEKSDFASDRYYSFYELGYDGMTEITNFDETESLSEKEHRYVLFNDALRNYKRRV